MPVVLADQSYGKSNVRLTRVLRRSDRHEIVEWSIDIEFHGDFADAYTAGDNRNVVATDTMKNRVYVLAKDLECACPEEFAMRYAQDCLTDYPQVASVGVTIAVQPWQRIAVRGQAHPHAFVSGPAGRRIAAVHQTRDEMHVSAGIEDLPLLKTTNSAFRDFYRDALTTLPDADDRILGTLLTANWSYTPGKHDWDRAYDDVRRQLLEAFAVHVSLGVQQTAHAMGAAVLLETPAVAEISLVMPNQHRLLVNLAPFGRSNDNEVFVTTSEPSGRITARLARRDEPA
jgi:urate oxidase